MDTTLPEPSHTRICLPHDESELKLPKANMRKPTQSYNMLVLDRSFASQKVASFESGSVVQMITSPEQMQSAFRQATSRRLLIAADETIESQWILGMLKYAAESGFTEFGFVVR